MNDAHLHLVLNHFPIIVPIVGALIMITGMFLKSPTIKKTALGVFILGGLLTFPAMFSGEGAEEIAENLPDVTEAIIHNHEEKAETMAIANYFLAGVSLLGLAVYWKRPNYGNYGSILAISISLVAIYLGRVAGTSGGEIRHTEIRSGNAYEKNIEKDDD